MSKRAEEAALKAYPIQDMYSSLIEGSNRLKREVFIKGYEQAEKDLGWISVKDRLPEVGDIVLVHDKICCTMRLAQLFKSGNWAYRREDGYGNRAVTVTVDYWMEIPKLPKEEKQ